MKKIFLSLVLFLSVAGVTAFASGRVTKEAESSFRKEFPSAEVLNWSQVGDYLQAVFILNGHRTIAYFREDGQFAGSMRSIFFDQLPLAASKAIDNKYKSADVIEIYEITNDEGTSYKISLNSEGKSYKLKVDGNGNISDSERVKK